MLDGEIVLFDDDGRQDFDALGQRIHPAESRINMLAEQTPTRFVAFDLLARRRRGRCSSCPQAERRDAAREAASTSPVDLTPRHRGPRRGRAVAAGRRGRDRQAPDAPYRPGERDGHGRRSSACARSTPSSSGWRPGKEEGTVGSLILGLYDDDGELRVVGHTSGFKAKEKRELLGQARAVRDRRARHRRPEPLDAATASSSGSTLRPELVVEVTFDHVSQRPHPPRREDLALARTNRPTAGWTSSRAGSDHRGGRRAGAAARLHTLAARPPLLHTVELLARGEQVRAVLDAPARERGQRGQQLVPGGRELIAHARGHAREDVALDQPVALQLAQGRGARPCASWSATG